MRQILRCLLRKGYSDTQKFVRNIETNRSIAAAVADFDRHPDDKEDEEGSILRYTLQLNRK